MVTTPSSYLGNDLTINALNLKSFQCRCNQEILNKALTTIYINETNYIWVLLLNFFRQNKENGCFDIKNIRNGRGKLRALECNKTNRHQEGLEDITGEIRQGIMKPYSFYNLQPDLDCCCETESDLIRRSMWLDYEFINFIERFMNTIIELMINAIDQNVSYRTFTGDYLNGQISQQVEVKTPLQDGIYTYDATTITNFNLDMLRTIQRKMFEASGRMGRLLFYLPPAAMEQIEKELADKWMTTSCCPDYGAFFNENFKQYRIYQNLIFIPAPFPQENFPVQKQAITIDSVKPTTTVAANTAVLGYVIAEDAFTLGHKGYTVPSFDMSYVKTALNKFKGRTFLGEDTYAMYARQNLDDNSLISPMNVRVNETTGRDLIGLQIRAEMVMGVLRNRAGAAARIAFSKDII